MMKIIKLLTGLFNHKLISNLELEAIERKFRVAINRLEPLSMADDNMRHSVEKEEVLLLLKEGLTVVHVVEKG